MATFSDNFTGVAAQKVLDRAGWTKYGPGWDGDGPEVNGSNQVRTSAGNDTALIGQDTGSADCFVQATVYSGFAWPGIGDRRLLCARSWDRNDMWGAAYNTEDGEYEIWKREGGSYSRAGTWAAPAPAGDVLRLEASGTTLTLKVNGTARITLSGITYGSTFTRSGVILPAGAGGVLDPVIDDYSSGDLGGEPADTEPPSLTGSITVGAKTSSSIQISFPAGSDNVGVVARDYRLNGGAWVSMGDVTTYNITGLTALTSYDIEVAARDAAALRSTPISVTTSTYRAGALGSTILLTTGPVDGNPAGILYNDVEAGDEGKWFSFRIIDQNLNGGTLSIDPDGTFEFTGAASGSFTYQLEVDGVDVGSPQLVTLYDQTTYRPSGDVTTTGWTSTGANFYDQINETPSSDASYVTSPPLSATTDPLTLDIASMSAGNYIAKFRARKTQTTGEVRMVFLGAGGASVGETTWQPVTTSFALYELPVTLTATAVKVKIEVRA